MEKIERTLVIIKPDAVRDGKVLDILSMITEEGFAIRRIRPPARMDYVLVAEHYAEHRDKPFYENLLTFMRSGPSVVLVVEGYHAVQHMRALIGPTNPSDAGPDTIRGRYGTSTTSNAVHASDSLVSAAIELKRFFSP